mgnify:FL=1
MVERMGNVPHEVTMPRLGQDMEQGLVVEWLKSVGDPVAEGETLALIETDKAEVVFEAPVAGYVIALLVEPGTTAEVGVPIAWISSSSDDEIPVVQPAEPTPVAKETVLAEEQPDGTLVGGSSQVETEVKQRSRKVSSPLARKRAAALGIALDSVEGSGPGGRVTEDDVLRASGQDAVGSRPGTEPPTLRPMRAAIAAHMSAAAAVPQFQIMREVEVEATEDARRAANASYTDLIVWATGRALERHPAVNARWVEGETPQIELLESVHLGFAVAVEGGLIVPVIRNVATLSLVETATERRRLEDAVLNQRLVATDLEGSTFTVSNLGSAGVDEFVALLNTPEAGILAVGAVRERPVVKAGALAVARTVRLTLTGDHRVYDGLVGARFMETIAGILTGEDTQDPKEDR